MNQHLPQVLAFEEEEVVEVETEGEVPVRVEEVGVSLCIVTLLMITTQTTVTGLPVKKVT